MMSQRPPCPVCNGEGTLPPGIAVERISAPLLPRVHLEFEKPKLCQTENAQHVPPIDLNVQPREYWLKDRALHLMRALIEQIAGGSRPSLTWAEELVDLVNEIAHT
jgi:hypothetical protein